MHIASPCIILLYIIQIVRRESPKAPPDIVNCISKLPANGIAYLFCGPERNGYEALPSYRIAPHDDLQRSFRSAEYNNHRIFEMCDASAAAAISAEMFIVASDENKVLCLKNCMKVDRKAQSFRAMSLILH